MMPSNLTSIPIPSIPKIPIEAMVDLEQLKKHCDSGDTVAVFGSSHTAIIALYNLVELGVNAINFYRTPLKYAVYYDDWILYDNTGLKGYSATWAKKYLEEKPDGPVLDTLQRYNITSPQFADKLSICTKSIEAVGFKRRDTIQIQGSQPSSLNYDAQNGQIATNLYGVGIAFPEGAYDRAGNFEYRVGMWKFMDYISRVLPLWKDGGNSHFFI